MRRTVSWRTWLICLLLAALPVKGMAAVWVLACCPPAQAPVVAAHEHDPHAGHAAPHEAAPAAADSAAHEHAAPADATTPSTAWHDHGKPSPAKASVCCAVAAIAPSSAAPWMAPPVADGPRAPDATRYASALLPALERPPRRG